MWEGKGGERGVDGGEARGGDGWRGVEEVEAWWKGWREWRSAEPERRMGGGYMRGAWRGEGREEEGGGMGRVREGEGCREGRGVGREGEVWREGVGGGVRGGRRAER